MALRIDREKCCVCPAAAAARPAKGQRLAARLAREAVIGMGGHKVCRADASLTPVPTALRCVQCASRGTVCEVANLAWHAAAQSVEGQVETRPLTSEAWQLSKLARQCSRNAKVETQRERAKTCKLAQLRW